MMLSWMDEAEALQSKQISQDEYAHWRYHHLTVVQTIHTHFAKVIPQELSDMLIAEDKKSANLCKRGNNMLRIVSGGLL